MGDLREMLTVLEAMTDAQLAELTQLVVEERERRKGLTRGQLVLVQ